MQDIFDYLQDWFASNGDFNGDGATTVQDIFDFLAAWFDGCPPPGIIHLSIYRVLRSPGDSPGYPYNAGSRLTDVDITNIIADLQTNQSVYGTGVVFIADSNPDGTVVVQDYYTPFLPANTGTLNSRRLSSTNMFGICNLAALDGFWDPDSYNIYFVGDEQANLSASPPAIEYARDLDPREADLNGLYALTMVNDFGYGGYFGFWPGYEPNWFAGTHGILHETGHYLGRLDQPFHATTTGWPIGGTPSRFYDRNEHFIEPTPVSRTNIMTPFNNPGETWPLVLPGDCLDTTTEKGQMFNKSRTHTLP